MSEEGQRVSMMVMPDALEDASAYRRLCVWFGAVSHQVG
jgi:hypothetical protein